jgi:hypothetical protein
MGKKIGLVAPEAVRANVKKGIEALKKELTGASLAPWEAIARGEPVPMDRIQIMKSWHEVFSGKPDSARFQLRGGVEGRIWSSSVMKSMEEAQKRIQEVKKDLSYLAYSGGADAGVHCHVVIRPERKTLVGGSHSHLFIIPTASSQVEVVYGSYDGDHQHRMEAPTSNSVEEAGSEHKHVVRIPVDIQLPNGQEIKAGSVFLTEEDGAHDHGADRLQGTNVDGAHAHELKLPGGLSVFAMDLETIYAVVTGGAVGQVTKELRAPTDREIAHAVVSGRADLLIKRDVIKEEAIAALEFQKKQFKDEATVVDWLVENGYSGNQKIEEEGSGFLVQLMEASEIDQESAREATLESGVKAVVGNRRDTIQKEKLDRVIKSAPEQVTIAKADEERQVVYGVVLEPELADFEGDIIDSDEIEKAAHQFLKEARVIKFRHKDVLKDATPVESYIAPVDMTLDGPNGKQKVRKGSWVLGVHVEDQAMWSDIKAKKLNAFSVGGRGYRTPVEA